MEWTAISKSDVRRMKISSDATNAANVNALNMLLDTKIAKNAI